MKVALRHTNRLRQRYLEIRGQDNGESGTEELPLLYMCCETPTLYVKPRIPIAEMRLPPTTWAIVASSIVLVMGVAGGLSARILCFSKNEPANRVSFNPSTSWSRAL